MGLEIAGRAFSSRLLLGTGKFGSLEVMSEALDASGAEIVTVALRRVDVSGEGDSFANILDYVDTEKYLLLANTSGAMNAEEAVRLARLAEAAGLPKWIKLEIHPDPNYLLPDAIETLSAAETLIKEGFTVLPYINADPVLAKRLEDAGAATVMPLGAPIPAMISSIATSVGKTVKKGDKVAVLEAMKMQTTLYAQADGVVDAVLVQVGDSVESKDLIARLR